MEIIWLQVRNRHGTDAITYSLTVMIPPPAPELRFAASNWSSVTLQWSINLPIGTLPSSNSKEYNLLSSNQVYHSLRPFIYIFNPLRSSSTSFSWNDSRYYLHKYQRIRRQKKTNKKTLTLQWFKNIVTVFESSIAETFEYSSRC